MQAINFGNSNDDSGAGQVAVSAGGTLVYATGGPVPQPMRALAWFDRSGAIEAINLPDRPYLSPRLAPDGRRIAMTIGPDSERRVWVYDLLRGALSVVTPPEDFPFYSIWSPDGQRIAFAMGGAHLALRSADGTGEVERLQWSAALPGSWLGDGRLLASVEGHPVTADDIWVRDLSKAKQPPRPFLQTPASETYPTFSPDGRWIAYVSNQSGRLEVYVQPYPGPGPRVLLSTAGGSAPAWGREGAGLYYVASAGPQTPGIEHMTAVTVRATASGLSADVPRKLFDGRFSLTAPVRGYDVTPDGKRFLMVLQKDLAPEPPIELVLVENWFEELKQRVPAK